MHQALLELLHLVHIFHGGEFGDVLRAVVRRFKVVLESFAGGVEEDDATEGGEGYDERNQINNCCPNLPTQIRIPHILPHDTIRLIGSLWLWPLTTKFEHFDLAHLFLAKTRAYLVYTSYPAAIPGVSILLIELLHDLISLH